MSDQLIVLDKITAAELFDASTGKMEALLADLKTAALAEVMDGSTPEGRLHCTRHKNKVVAAQKAFDELKKSQTKHLKDEATRIDKMGKKANDLCEELKARVEWEAKEAERVQNHREAIRYIQETGFPNVLINSPLPDLLATYEDAKTRLNVVEVGKGFEEFEEEAFKVYNEAVANVSTNIAVIKDQIEKAERLAELEAAETKRLKEENDDRLRKEGEEQAKQKLKEEQEAARQQKHRSAIDEIKSLGEPLLAGSAQAQLNMARSRLADLNNIQVPNESFDELEDEAMKFYRITSAFLQRVIQSTQEAVDKEEELAQLRKEKQEEPEAEEPPHILAPISESAQEALTQPQSHDLGHKRNVNRSIRDALVTVAGITESKAQAIVTAVYYGEIEHLTIQY